MVLCLKTWESRSSPGLHVCDQTRLVWQSQTNVITSLPNPKPPAVQTAGVFCVYPRKKTGGLAGVPPAGAGLPPLAKRNPHPIYAIYPRPHVRLYSQPSGQAASSQPNPTARTVKSSDYTRRLRDAWRALHPSRQRWRACWLPKPGFRPRPPVPACSTTRGSGPRCHLPAQRARRSP
jgi:hypothetical protein